MLRPPPTTTLFPYTTLFRSSRYLTHVRRLRDPAGPVKLLLERIRPIRRRLAAVLVQLPPRFHAEPARRRAGRSEEHTSELQSHVNLVCRLLLEKKKELCDEL